MQDGMLRVNHEAKEEIDMATFNDNFEAWRKEHRAKIHAKMTDGRRRPKLPINHIDSILKSTEKWIEVMLDPEDISIHL